MTIQPSTELSAGSNDRPAAPQIPPVRSADVAIGTRGETAEGRASLDKARVVARTTPTLLRRPPVICGSDAVMA